MLGVSWESLLKAGTLHYRAGIWGTLIQCAHAVQRSILQEQALNCVSVVCGWSYSARRRQPVLVSTGYIVPAIPMVAFFEPTLRCHFDWQTMGLPTFASVVGCHLSLCLLANCSLTTPLFCSCMYQQHMCPFLSRGLASTMHNVTSQ